MGHPVLVDFNDPFPRELDFVAPESAVAAPAGVVRTSGGLRLALDADPDWNVAVPIDFACPELTLFEIASAAGEAERVHVQLPQERMAHEQPGQIVGQAETLGAGVCQLPGQCLLHGNGHVKAVLDVLLLTHRVGQRLALHVERPGAGAPRVPPARGSG